MQPHISLAAEKIGSIFGLPVTNSLFMSWLVMAILIFLAYLSTRNITPVPSNIQSIAEVIIQGLHSLFASVVGEKNIERFFPLLATIFLFIAMANWSGLLPGVGSIGFRAEAHSQTPSDFTVDEELSAVETFGEHNEPDTALMNGNVEPVDEELVDEERMVAENTDTEVHTSFKPLFRGPTADLNMTLAVALFAVASLQYYGFQTLGLSYIKKYINFSDPIMFFVGILELISELAKIVSFAFRLFGNIFAGEVLLTVIAFLMPLIAPLPFLGLELFVGFIQALVFSMLTAVFLNMATMKHEH